MGIHGLFYNIVKSMYVDNTLRIKIGQGLTDEFLSELSGSSSRCHGVVCGLWFLYFLIILTYYFRCETG